MRRDPYLCCSAATYHCGHVTRINRTGLFAQAIIGGHVTRAAPQSAAIRGRKLKLTFSAGVVTLFPDFPINNFGCCAPKQKLGPRSVMHNGRDEM
jgi:hypothetical protein